MLLLVRVVWTAGLVELTLGAAARGSNSNRGSGRGRAAPQSGCDVSGRLLVLASSVLFVAACSGSDTLRVHSADGGADGTAGTPSRPGGPGGGGTDDSGTGGTVDGPGGAEGGDGGTGGTAGHGGAGGAAGEGGQGQGGGGDGGWDGGWLLDDDVWRELPEVAGGGAEARAWQGRRERFQFPTLTWEPCAGDVCERAVFGASFIPGRSPSMGQVLTDRGPGVWLAFTQPLGKGEYRRIVDLSTGETVAALRMDHESGTVSRENGGRNLAGSYESATTIVAKSNRKVVVGAYDWETDRWDFKLPWSNGEAFEAPYCVQFDVDTSPPTFLAGCGFTSSATLTPGSARLTTLSKGASFLDGSGHAGLAAWSEMYEWDRPNHHSRVVTWSAEAGTTALVDRIHGEVCGVAVGQDRVVGFRASDVNYQYGCGGRLLEPELWWVSRNGGEVHTLPIDSLSGFRVLRTVTWGDYVAALILKNPATVSWWTSKNFSTVLIRISDGAIRELSVYGTDVYEDKMVGLDSDYLYLGESDRERPLRIGTLRRFPLSEFDRIGLEPADIPE